MNNEGFGSNGAPFTYTVEKEGKTKKKRKILLIALYVVWVIVFFTVGVLTKLILPLLCFIPLSVWLLVWLTWKYTHEEISITLFSGTMTVTRLFDGKKPKKLAEVKIKDIECYERYSAEKIAEYKPENVINGIRDTNYDEAYIASWGESAVIMETNEKAVKIIKYYNSSLFKA